MRTADPLIYFCTWPRAQTNKKNTVTHTQGNDQRRQKESDASRLPLLQATVGHALSLVHLGSVAGGLEGIASSGQRLEVGAVLFMGLIKNIY